MIWIDEAQFAQSAHSERRVFFVKKHFVLEEGCHCTWKGVMPRTGEPNEKSRAKTGVSSSFLVKMPLLTLEGLFERLQAPCQSNKGHFTEKTKLKK